MKSITILEMSKGNIFEQRCIDEVVEKNNGRKSDDTSELQIYENEYDIFYEAELPNRFYFEQSLTA
jgi:hypothetical protein